jgi:hypothetical protein
VGFTDPLLIRASQAVQGLAKARGATSVSYMGESPAMSRRTKPRPAERATFVVSTRFASVFDPFLPAAAQPRAAGSDNVLPHIDL